MHPDLDLLLQLQSQDQRIAALEKEIADLPKQIATMERTLESHVRKLEADRAALSSNQRDRKKLDGDIQLSQQKISKLRDQMLGAKTNEQYRAFQHEIEYIEKEIRAAEDRTIELMSAAEPLEAAVKKAEVALNEEKKVVAAEQQQAKARSAADQVQLAEARDRRQNLAAKLSGATLSSYERIRRKWNGVTVAEATNGRCSACQLVLRPQHFQDLRRGSQILTCENCGRFLFYNPAVTAEGTRVAMS